MRRTPLILALLTTFAALCAVAIAAPSNRTGPRLMRWHGLPVRALDEPATSAAAVPAPTAIPGSPDLRLSNERTVTRWAHVWNATPITVHPNTRSTQVARLHKYTEDGFAEVYVVLRSHVDAAGVEWVRLRVPARPNGLVGWVRRSSLGPFQATNLQLVLNRRRLRIFLFQNGKLRWSAPVGIGKPSSPTPPGDFWIRERFQILQRKSGYWPYAFGTADYSTLTDWPGGGVVGIHGPYYQPKLIPGRPSHGCIRLHVQDDAYVAKHISLGTPLKIR
ncbi:MAG: hypothetical protein NVSMB25_15150 [Thermoleophilaceae bacterium]